jgi:hypothetical protein
MNRVLVTLPAAEADYIGLAAQFRRILPYLVVQPTKSPQKQH